MGKTGFIPVRMYGVDERLQKDEDIQDGVVVGGECSP